MKPGPCCYTFLEAIFFLDGTSVAYYKWLVTEWGDPLGLSHSEEEHFCPWSNRGSCRGLNLHPLSKMTGSQAACECMQTSLGIQLPWSSYFIGCYNAGVLSPILKHSSKFRCWDPPKMLHWRGGRDSFHFCSFQTLLQISGCLNAYLPENRLSHWPVQTSLFAQLAVCLCLLDVEWLWHLSLLWTEAQHGLVALYKRPQPYWQHAIIWVTNNNIPSCLSNREKDPGINSFLSASPTESILSCCFPLSAVAERLQS